MTDNTERRMPQWEAIELASDFLKMAGFTDIKCATCVYERAIEMLESRWVIGFIEPKCTLFVREDKSVRYW